MRSRAVLSAVAALTVAVFTVVLLTRSEAAPAPAELKDETFLDVDHPGVRGFENGDCFQDPAINAHAQEPLLNTVQCIGAQNEVYTFLTLADGAWNPARVAAETRRGCGDAFEQIWGASSPYRFYGVLPTRRSWEQELDRNAMCVVYEPGAAFAVDPIEAAAAN